jgi:hypothetical protein
VKRPEEPVPGAPSSRGESEPPGKHAFEAELGRIASGIVVADNDPRVREVSKAISRARAAADSGDFIGAIRLLGDVTVTVTPENAPALAAGIKPEDVEQALGDLRRALKRAGDFEGKGAVETLCKAARAEAASGRWQAAWALIDEADGRLAEVLGRKRSH